MSRTVVPHESPKYKPARPAPTHHTFSESVKWNLFFLSTCRLQAKPDWPLAGYYAYMDTGVYDSLSFEELGLLWTDEKGALHQTGADGRPTELVTHFALAWTSMYQDADIETCTLIYDDSLERLNRRKQQVEQAGRGSALAAKYKVKKKQLTRFALEEGGYPSGAYITVPPDDEVLPLKRLEALMAELEKSLKAASSVQQSIQSLIAHNVDNQVICFHRQQINAWLNQPGEDRRQHLVRMDGTNPNGETRWDADCRIYDNDMRKLVIAYEDALDPLFELFEDKAKTAMLGQIGLIVEKDDDRTGEHLLWRHQFLLEAGGLFCGSRRHKETFEKLVQPIFQGLAEPFSTFRVQCKCPTCESMVEGKTAVSDKTLAERIHYEGWRSRDLRIGTSTLLRVIDVATKFAPNWAYLMCTGVWTSKSLANAGVFSWWFFVRAGVVGPGGSSPEIADQWFGLIQKLVEDAQKGEGKLDELVQKTTGFLKAKVPYKFSIGLELTGDFLGVVGAGILTYSVLFKHGKLNLKDAMDLARALADTAKAGVGASRRILELKMVAEFGETEGKQIAKALPSYARLASAGKYLGAAGGVFQVASSWISLRDAADKGDKREFAWVAIQYFGADVAFSGVALDLCPEPVVTKGSGVALNFIGGIIYLAGQAGEFFTRPGEEEMFLTTRNYYR
jgi:hypothetical protein